MYIGEIKDATPMPRPLTILPAINQLTVGASAVPTALNVKIIPARMISFRRPKRFVRAPPRAAPTAAPTRTELTTISSIVADKENCFVMNRMAPEMTPVS
jgi:hypothetical protein